MTPRRWLVLAIAATVLASWLAFAHGLAPALIAAAHQGRSVPVLNRLVQRLAGKATLTQVLERWSETADAVAFAGVLWLGVLMVLREGSRKGPGDAQGGQTERAARRVDPVLLGGLSLAFLGYTIGAGVVQDYFLYLGMWREIRLGHDPWFLVSGVFGTYPLNAYGPLFSVLAMPAWINPLWPKLLFATAYVLFAVWLMQDRGEGERSSLFGALVHLVGIWNPYVWVEVAHYGHFDILVGLLCVAAMEARARGRDLTSGLFLGLGVLLKFMPFVLLPFLVLDGKRIRWRLLFAAAGLIVLGMTLSLVIWGPSTFRPLGFAASRGSHHLSIYRFMTGVYSPVAGLMRGSSLEQWAPVILMLGLLRTWSWHRQRNIATEPAAVIALFVTVLLYQVGFSQYHMVPFMMAAWWLVKRRVAVSYRIPLAIALGAYIGWLSVFDLITSYIDIDTTRMQEWVGLPTFLLGCAVVAFMVAASKGSSHESVP
jgi:hypothetical protein